MTRETFYVEVGSSGLFQAQSDQTAMIPRAARKYTVTELFAGAGIWSKALSGSQLQGVAFAESDPVARSAFKSNYGGVEYTSVENCLQSDDSKPEFGMMAWPCTPYARSGQKSGLSHPSFKSFVTALKYFQTQQSYFVLGENVPDIRTDGNGRIFQLVLDTIRHHGFEVFCEEMNPIHWGYPVDRTRVFFSMIRSDIASKLPPHLLKGLSRPLTTTTKFRTLRDIMEIEPTLPEGKVFDITNPGIKWFEGYDPFKEQFAPLSDYGSPTRAITIGYMPGGKRTGFKIISSRGALRTLTSWDCAEGPGKNQCVVFDEAAFLNNREHVCLRVLSLNELKKAYGLHKSFKLNKDFDSSVSLLGRGTHYAPTTTALQYGHMLVSKVLISSNTPPRQMPSRKITRMEDIITTYGMRMINIWISKMQQAVIAFREKGTNIRVPPFRGDIDVMM